MPALSVVAFLACGGDDTNGNGTGNDAGGADASTSDVVTGGDSGGGTDSGAPAPVPVAADGDAYTWTIATLDGSGSTPSGASFSWLLATAPAGSAVTSASIQGAATSKASFVPDVVGEFAFTLKVTSGGVSATKNVKVHAYPGKVLYTLSQNQDGAPPLTDVHFNTTDTASPTQISCTLRDVIGGIGGAYATFLTSSLDWREGAPAEDPQLVFGFKDDLADGGSQAYLGAVKTKMATCGQGTLAKLDLQVNPQATYGGIPRLPRLSPGGTRIAYVRDTTNGPIVTTIGFDGSNPHSFGSEFPEQDASAGGAVTFAIRWLSETEIAWMTRTSSTSSWSIQHANDVDSAVPTVDMTCATTPPDEFAALSDGSYLVAIGTLADGGLGGTSQDEADLVVLKPDLSKNCQIVRNLTHGVVSSSADDFSVSPDGTKVAFLEQTPVDGGGANTAVYVAPVDGSSPPALVPGAPTSGATFGDGPRWVSGGGMLAWGQTGASIGAAVTSNVVVAPVAGGTALKTVNASADTDYYATAAGNVQLFSCDIGRVGFRETAPCGALVASAAGIFAFARRRRRRKGQKDDA